MADKTKIDWCDMSWNPVTGCLHDCPYCYAKRVTNRFGAHLTPLSGKQTAILEKPDYFMQGNVKVRSSPFPFDFTVTGWRSLPARPNPVISSSAPWPTCLVGGCRLSGLWRCWTPVGLHPSTISCSSLKIRPDMRSWTSWPSCRGKITFGMGQR